MAVPDDMLREAMRTSRDTLEQRKRIGGKYLTDVIYRNKICKSSEVV
jgi:hypothetical protein